MTDSLIELAKAAGVAPDWKDVHGRVHAVGVETLRAVLRALELPCDTAGELAESRMKAMQTQTASPLTTAAAGEPITYAVSGRFKLRLENGEVLEGSDRLPAITQVGYHVLETSDRQHCIAVAPKAGWGLPRERCWGLAVQLYSLRREGDAGIGDFAALGSFVRSAGARGADAVAISPVHAQFSADPDRFSPYAPSSRIMLNVLHANAPRGNADLEQANLVDWPAAARVRLGQFRHDYEQRKGSAELDAFRRSMGEPLEAHARFETLHAHFFGHDETLWNWRRWPEEYRDPGSAAVQAFAEEHAHEVGFHAYLQYVADRDMAAAQRVAKESGMGIGLVSDLAVGTDGGGSHCWSRQSETLIGLSVGAPPDLLNTRGQNWGITAFSPRGLELHGFQAFIEMLRASLRHAGGVRIDHVMGLQRLWVVPDGAGASDGAYLSFPVRDLLRLSSLESYRHKAVVLGEDLGTVPDGFHERLTDAGVLGMRVLWFEENADKTFKSPRAWTRNAIAMTTTHDLPTVAGWWKGTDIGWRRHIGMLPDDTAIWFEKENRARARRSLWDAFRESGATIEEMPPNEHTHEVVDAAVAHVAKAACRLLLLPIEDALGREEQPNLPGTIDEHPNWRRRMPGPAADLLDHPKVAARIETMARERPRE